MKKEKKEKKENLVGCMCVCMPKLLDSYLPCNNSETTGNFWSFCILVSTRVIAGAIAGGTSVGKLVVDIQKN